MHFQLPPWIGLAALCAVFVAALFKGAYRQEPDGRGELEAFARTLMTALGAHLVTAGNRAGECLAPFAPVTARERPLSPLGLPLPPVASHAFAVDGAALRLDVFTAASPLHNKPNERLRAADILAEPYPPASSHEVPLIHKGVALSERFLEKITSFAQESPNAPPVPVYTPSPMARHYLVRNAENLVGAGV